MDKTLSIPWTENINNPHTINLTDLARSQHTDLHVLASKIGG